MRAKTLSLILFPLLVTVILATGACSDTEEQSPEDCDIESDIENSVDGDANSEHADDESGDQETTCDPTEIAQNGIQAPLCYKANLDAGALLPLHTDGLRIRDAAGRDVILRGLQHHQLQDVDYFGRDVADSDYAMIASWGYTTLRVAISWSRIEPQKGHYDSAYLGEIRTVMDKAHSAGLTVIVEMHQDLWARCTQEDDSGMRPNANGAPDWTCDLFPDFQKGQFAHWPMFDHMWANDEGLMDSQIAAWAAVLDEVGEHPALLGLDVINEPQGLGNSPELERDKIFPGFRTLCPALRATGAPGLLFLDSSILRNETFKMYTEDLTDIGPDLVYAPHMYSGWMKLYLFGLRIPQEDKLEDFASASQQAQELGLPLWNGEWAANYYTEGSLEDIAFNMSLEDEYRIGSSFWAFQHAVPGQGDISISGGQSILNEDMSVRWDLVDQLSRPYPIQTPGQLNSFAFTPNEFTPQLDVNFTVDDGDQAPLVIFTSTNDLGERPCLTVSPDANWSWDYDADAQRLLVQVHEAGTYQVALAKCDKN
jgi:hypothetical protein